MLVVIALSVLCAMTVCDRVLTASAKNRVVEYLTEVFLSGASFNLLRVVFAVACASTFVFFTTSWIHASLWMHALWTVVCSQICMIIVVYLLVMGGLFRDKDSQGPIGEHFTVPKTS